MQETLRSFQRRFLIVYQAPHRRNIRSEVSTESLGKSNIRKTDAVANVACIGGGQKLQYWTLYAKRDHTVSPIVDSPPLTSLVLYMYYWQAVPEFHILP